MPSPFLSILKKIEQVNQQRSKSGKQPYRLNDPLPEETILQFERKHNIKLPEDYREFLLQVGDGNQESYCYKINPLSETDRFNPLDDGTLYLSRAFPFTGRQGEEIIKETIYKFYPASMVNNILADSKCDDIPGCLLLNYEGWGSSFLALVITGEQRGTIWHVNDLHHPFYKREGKSIITSFSFVDWVEYNLDQELQPSIQELIEAKRYHNVIVANLSGEAQEWQNSFDLDRVFQCVNLTFLDLSRNYNIKELPEEIGNLQHLVHFNFNGGSLQRLPNALCTLRNLEILEMSYQQLRTLPDDIGNLHQLKRLILYWNRELKILPQSLSKLTNLIYLSIAYCDVLDLAQALPIIGQLHGVKELQLTTADVPDEVAMVSRLEELKIEKPYGEPCVKLSNKIADLTHLKVLDLSNCGLTEVPTWVEEMRYLEHLDLSANPLTSLSNGLGSLTNLRYLNLSNTPLRQIPESFAALQKLSEIEIDRCHDLQLPNAFSVLGKLPKLTHLYLDTPSVVPKEIGALQYVKEFIIKSSSEEQQIISADFNNLHNLEWLHIATKGNLIIPSELAQLKNLNVLILNAPNITLPENLGDLNSLVELDIDCDNGLAMFPESFHKLKNLNTIRLIGPHRIEMPKVFRLLSMLPKLRHLTISTKEVPSEIGLCRQLKTLTIDNYPDEHPAYKDALKLPAEIGLLKELKELRLSENQLESLPETIAELNNLVYLDISENKLTCIPPQILKLPMLRELYQ